MKAEQGKPGSFRGLRALVRGFSHGDFRKVTGQEKAMKKTWLSAVLLGFLFCTPAWAELSRKGLRDLNLEKEPLVVAASADGEMVFILVPGELKGGN